MKARLSNPDGRELELSDMDGLRRFENKAAHACTAHAPLT
jgi:hypothetical protein